MIARTDRSIIGRWWWTVDRPLLTMTFALSLLGVFLVTAASPAVAEHLKLSSFHFVNRHLVYLVISISAMLIISMMSEDWMRRMATLGLLGAMGLMLLTLFMGAEAKGATRWIYVGPFSLQPSEFMKPCFAIVAAWLIARQQEGFARKNYGVLAGLTAIIVVLLLSQPDLGMTVLTLIMLGSQVFMAGFPIFLILILGGAGVTLLVWAYFNLPHVQSRMDRFFNPESGDTYQIEKAMDAFASGGLFGVGPGEGTIKMRLPDAHADFIFAVSGEEMGLIWTMILVVLFAAIIYRIISKALHSHSLFGVLALSGLVTLFTCQTLIHMMSSLHMIPTKGMTLPFVSYGGSSLISIGILMGFVLSLCRKKPSFKGVRAPSNLAKSSLPKNTKTIPVSGKIS